MRPSSLLAVIAHPDKRIVEPPKKVLYVGVAKQMQSAWFINKNKKIQRFRKILATISAVFPKLPEKGHVDGAKTMLHRLNVEGGKTSSWDYVQKIKKHLKHFFTKFQLSTIYRF